MSWIGHARHANTYRLRTDFFDTAGRSNQGSLGRHAARKSGPAAGDGARSVTHWPIRPGASDVVREAIEDYPAKRIERAYVPDSFWTNSANNTRCAWGMDGNGSVDISTKPASGLAHGSSPRWKRYKEGGERSN